MSVAQGAAAQETEARGTEAAPSRLANGYAASGTKDVGSLNTASSKVDFEVSVPRPGSEVAPVLG